MTIAADECEWRSASCSCRNDWRSLARGLTSAVVRLASIARAEEECGVDSSSQMRVREPDSRAVRERAEISFGSRAETSDASWERAVERRSSSSPAAAREGARGCERRTRERGAFIILTVDGSQQRVREVLALRTRRRRRLDVRDRLGRLRRRAPSARALHGREEEERDTEAEAVGQSSRPLFPLSYQLLVDSLLRRSTFPYAALSQNYAS